MSVKRIVITGLALGMAVFGVVLLLLGDTKEDAVPLILTGLCAAPVALFLDRDL